MYPDVGDGLEALYLVLSDRYSVSTIRQVHAVLSSCLTDAVERGLLNRNPAKAAKRPKHVPVFRETPRARDRTWLKDDLQVFLAATEGDRLHIVRWLAAATGMRCEEYAGLKWSNVNNAGSLIVMSVSTAFGTEVFEDAPKTDKGRRAIDLDDETVRRLELWQEQQEADALTAGKAYRAQRLRAHQRVGSAVPPGLPDQAVC